MTRSVRRLSVNDDSIMEKDDSELSGTEYLDRVFFPEATPTSAIIENEEEQPKDFFEESFFRRVKSVEASTTSSEIRFQHENSQDHKRIKRKDSAKILHEENMDFSAKLRQSSAVKSPRNESLPKKETGWDQIRREFLPVWKMSPDELVDLMVNRVLFKNDDVVAFDKPYGMAYSGASSTVPQLDRLLQRIKAKVVPKCERLYLVRSLDKYQSGIILFATYNSAMQLALKEDFQKGLVEQVTRCIVCDELKDSRIKITIPLIKAVKNRDVKLLPLITNSTKGEIFYVESDCRTVQGRQYVSSVEVRTRREVSHQIRAHLAMARCPLIGDSKYSGSSPRPPRLSQHVLNSLNMTDSQARKIPMYIHLKEV
ncbi:Mitochondrial RNA pseudouridine synthase rpusd4 [Parelaphostrongylus tenuis]|uniref:Pseudouridylate synthase RPUSD4, mitochondrial n=1 Tax=Parelaphostrongylus tenuis TaxID=148309 RepID=A0AAD5WHC0_PARTN|nr:Mitochondrial RNA pseudouridine synthase rpusd4 [Parelaphostrongylus tenuis]